MSEQTNFIQIDRRWFLTWTTYGTWLPGDERGFTGTAENELGQIVNYNQFGTQPGSPNVPFRKFAEHLLKTKPIVLTYEEAQDLYRQFQETVRFRGWLILAVGIMHAHVHVIVGVPGDPKPEKLLNDLKAYGTRCLNEKSGRLASDTWWTTKGSKRKLECDIDVASSVQYVRQQPNPLLIWTRDDGFLLGEA